MNTPFRKLWPAEAWDPRTHGRCGHALRRRLSFEPCARSLVAGHYQPLADNPGVAPEPDQTVLCSRIRETIFEITWKDPDCRARPFQVLSKGHRPVRKARKAGRRNRRPACRTRAITSVRPWRRRLPASSCAASASALDMASLTGFGAPSTRSLASFRPRPVSSRTALMTCTLLAPASSQHDVELGLLFDDRSGSAATAAAGRRGHRRGATRRTSLRWP